MRASGYENKFCLEKLINNLDQRNMAGYERCPAKGGFTIIPIMERPIY